VTRSISESKLSRLSAFIAARMGLHFSKERWKDLERGINATARELGIEDGDSCIDWLLSSSLTRGQIEILASHLTIGETYFFRDKRSFKALRESVLAELIRPRRNNGRHLRIWSAGCSTGEEPYSIAILLNQMIPDIGNWNISILATDINTRFLQKAADGIYGRWSFRDIEPGIREKFFNQKADGRFELLSRIRDMVTFSYLNLVEDTYPSLVNNTNAMDIIFCRNVLLYFVPDLGEKVIRNFYRGLVNGGFLLVSAGELSNPFFSQFTPIRAAGTMLYKKEGPAGGFPCRPIEKPKITFKRAFNFPTAAAPALKPTGVEVSTQAETQNAQLQLRTSEAAPRNREDLYQEALLLYDEGCYPEAAETAEKILSQGPLDAKGLALLARIHANWGRLDQALRWCEKAVSAEKLHAGYHYLMATILQELGRTEEAAVSLRRTLYLDPKFVLAYVGLGNLSRRHGKRKESARHFENALALLVSKRPEDVLPESEGISAGRLRQMIETLRQTESGR
jgi:chemotaxis protein methyltransferase CheR